MTDGATGDARLLLTERGEVVDQCEDKDFNFITMEEGVFSVDTKKKSVCFIAIKVCVFKRSDDQNSEI